MWSGISSVAINWNWLLNLNLTYKTLWAVAGSGLLISMLEKFNWFHLTHLKTLVLLMWKWRGLLSRTKSSFKMLGLTFSSKLDCGSCIISVAKTASRKIGALIHSMKFLSPEVSLYLYKLTIGPCMEYCCNVWAGAPRCYSQLLDKLQKWICRTVGPSFRCCLSWNLASSLKCSQLKSFL